MNTDVAGFLAPLQRRGIELRQLRATILGAGGAARAAAEGLTSAGADVAIAARRTEQATNVARLLGSKTSAWPPPPGSWDLLVNATQGAIPVPLSEPILEGLFARPAAENILLEQLLFSRVFDLGLDPIVFSTSVLAQRFQIGNGTGTPE